MVRRATSKNRKQERREQREAFLIEKEAREAAARNRLRVFALSAGLILVTLVIYAFPAGNSFRGVFLFDDFAQITDSEKVVRSESIDFGRKLMFRRPIPYLTFVANYKMSGDDTFGYHVVNFSIHLVAGLALFGLVRRALRSPRLEGVFGDMADWIAATIALFWMIHPLQTQSVTYIVQRAESMMGMFYLLTIYFVAKGADAKRPAGWYAAAVFACLLGTMSKAVIVTAPLVAFLYDATFLAGSYKEALRRRWGLYVLLFLSLIKLSIGKGSAVQGVMSTHSRDSSVGFDVQGISGWDYLRSQAGVLLHYLRLVVWPHPQSLDYYWPVASVAEAIVPGLIILALLGLTAWALVKKPALGFLGAWFFLILAPTSTVIPIKDLAFEHRMYVPLAGVVALVVIGLYFGVRKLIATGALNQRSGRTAMVCVGAVLFTALSARTVARNADYLDEKQMWQRVIDEMPHNDRGFYQLGRAYAREKQWDRAVELYEKSLSINEDRNESYSDIGVAFDERARAAEQANDRRKAFDLYEKALEYYQKALERKPRLETAHYNKGTTLLALRRYDEAIEAFRRAISIKPFYNKAKINLANAYVRRNMDYPERDDVEASYREAVRFYADALAEVPEKSDARQNMAVALIKLGETAAARQNLQIVLNQVTPSEANTLLSAHYNMGISYLADGDDGAAWQHFEKLVKLRGNEAVGYYEIGSKLARDGENQAAIQALRRSRKADPSNVRVQQLIEVLRNKTAAGSENISEE